MPEIMVSVHRLVLEPVSFGFVLQETAAQAAIASSTLAARWQTPWA